MVRALALLGAAVSGAYVVAAGYFSVGDIVDLPSALLAFAVGTGAILVALRCL